MPLHVYNIIIPGGLGLEEEKSFSLPFGEKRKQALLIALRLASDFEHSWSVPSLRHSPSWEKKKTKKEVRAGEFRAMQKERKKSAGGARYIN